MARSISPIRGTAGCRSTASSGRASSASRASIACRRAAASRNCWSTAICSISRTGCAFRRTRSCSTSTIPCRHLIRVFDVQPTAASATAAFSPPASSRRAEPGVPDGMKCDAHGNVWVSAPGGVWVYAPDGALIGKVRVPELVGNLTWGGSDWRTLFMTATHSVYAVRDQGRPARRAVYARSRRPAAAGSAPLRRRRHRSAAPSGRAGLRARSLALRAHHSGHAERRGDGRRRLCLLRLAAALPRTERHRQCPPARGGRACARRSGHPRLVRGRAGRARRDAERAAVRGRCSMPSAMVRGTWGAAPVPGLEPQPGDQVVEKMRMSAWEGTRLETDAESGRARHRHRHRRLDQHVDRAHRPHRRGQGLSTWSCRRIAARP